MTTKKPCVFYKAVTSKTFQHYLRQTLLAKHRFHFSKIPHKFSTTKFVKSVQFTAHPTAATFSLRYSTLFLPQESQKYFLMP